MAIPFHDKRTGEILYHGTNAPLKVGDVIEPKESGTVQNAIKRGSTGWSKADVDKHTPMAFATPNAGEAQFYANQTAKPEADSRRTSKARKPRVYTVEPVNHESVIRMPGGSPINKEAASPHGFKVTGVAHEGEAHPALNKEQKNNLQRKRRRPVSVPRVTGLPKKPESTSTDVANRMIDELKAEGAWPKDL